MQCYHSFSLSSSVLFFHQLIVPGLIGFFQFFLSLRVNGKYVKGKPYKRVDCGKKVYIVTGCNTGIGYETAKALVEMGGTVIMACRSVDKANEAREAILAAVKCSPSKVRYRHQSTTYFDYLFLLPLQQLIVKRLDLCSFESVRNFVKVKYDAFYVSIFLKSLSLSLSLSVLSFQI